MAGTMFMRVEEFAEELGVSVPYAYKLIHSMNAELGDVIKKLNHQMACEKRTN